MPIRNGMLKMLYFQGGIRKLPGFAAVGITCFL